MKGNFYLIVDNIIMDSNMDMESLYGLISLYTKANSMTIKSKVKVE